MVQQKGQISSQKCPQCNKSCTMKNVKLLCATRFRDVVPHHKISTTRFPFTRKGSRAFELYASLNKFTLMHWNCLLMYAGDTLIYWNGVMIYWIVRLIYYDSRIMHWNANLKHRNTKLKHWDVRLKHWDKGLTPWDGESMHSTGVFGLCIFFGFYIMYWIFLFFILFYLFFFNFPSFLVTFSDFGVS